MVFSSWFTTSTEPDPLPEVTPELALGTLLVRMAKSDNRYHVAEISVMDRVLATQYNLDPVEAAKMRATCERLEKAGADTEALAALIHDNVPAATRRMLIKALVDVAEADGISRPEEKALIDQLAVGLGPEER